VYVAQFGPSTVIDVRVAASLVTVDDEIERDFEARLVESSTLVFRVAYSILRHRQDAEDVAQEAFAKAYRSFRQLRDRQRFRAWLVRIAWRMALDRQRANRRRSAHEEPFGDPVEASTEPDDGEARERSAHLWRAIDDLPEKLRVVTVLAAIEGHDMREVSRLLQVPEGTVKWRLFAARKQLLESLRWLKTEPRSR
jgi:RNA polymerase sigma-70 factor (ECF subfamily)